MMNRKNQKKETFEYIENPEQMKGFYEIPVPDDLDQRIQAGIEKGKNNYNSKKQGK